MKMKMETLQILKSSGKPGIVLQPSLDNLEVTEDAEMPKRLFDSITLGTQTRRSRLQYLFGRNSNNMDLWRFMKMSQYLWPLCAGILLVTVLRLTIPDSKIFVRLLTVNLIVSTIASLMVYEVMKWR